MVQKKIMMMMTVKAAEVVAEEAADVLALVSAAALAPSAALLMSTALARFVHTVVEGVAVAAAVGTLTIQTRKKRRSAPREPSPTAGSLATLSARRIAQLTLPRS